MIYKIADRMLTVYEKRGIKSDILQGILMVLAFLLFFPPRMLMTISVYEKVDVYLKLVMAAYVYFIALLFLIRMKRIPVFIIVVNLYCGALFLSTIIHHGDLKNAIWGNWVLIMAMIFLIWISMIRDVKWCLKLLYGIYYISILINLYFVIRTALMGVPDEFMEKIYFFGNYNGFIQWFMPAQVVGYILAKMSNNKYVKASYLILCILNLGVIFYVDSLTSMIILSAFDLYMLLLNRKIINRVFNIITYMIANLLFFVFVVVLRVQNYLIASGLLQMNSEITFSGRTPIWNNALKVIKENMLLGAGIEPLEVSRAKLGISTAHNMWLEILYMGGIIALILFAIVIIILVVRIIKEKNLDNKIIGCISTFFGCFFLASQFESQSNMVFILFFSIVYFGLDAFVKRNFLAE